MGDAAITGAPGRCKPRIGITPAPSDLCRGENHISIAVGMVRAAPLTSNCPLQYHLDRESLEDNSYVQHGGNTAHVGRKLRHFWDDLFLKAGYMVMHVRNTVQTRNIDILLVKVFCKMRD